MENTNASLQISSEVKWEFYLVSSGSHKNLTLHLSKLKDLARVSRDRNFWWQGQQVVLSMCLMITIKGVHWIFCPLKQQHLLMMGKWLALFMEYFDNSAVYGGYIKKRTTLSSHKMLHHNFSIKLLKKELWIVFVAMQRGHTGISYLN